MTNRAELRRLAEAVRDDYWSPDVGMTTAETMYACAAAPGVVLSLLDECESLHSAMGSTDEITAEPAGDYEALRKQFMSLLMLANSKAKQAQHWRSQSGHTMHQTLVQTAANVNAERDTNAMLTDALMKAEAERDAALAELEACRKDAVDLQAAKLLLEQCNEVIAEDGGVYIELRCFLSGEMPAADIIALLGKWNRNA